MFWFAFSDGKPSGGDYTNTPPCFLPRHDLAPTLPSHYVDAIPPASQLPPLMLGCKEISGRASPSSPPAWPALRGLAQISAILWLASPATLGHAITDLACILVWKYTCQVCARHQVFVLSSNDISTRLRETPLFYVLSETLRPDFPQLKLRKLWDRYFLFCFVETVTTWKKGKKAKTKSAKSLFYSADSAVVAVVLFTIRSYQTKCLITYTTLLSE